MIRIQAPNGELVEFPDDTPESVMLDAMRREYGGPSTATETGMDVAKSAGVGLGQGLIGIAGLPATVTGLMEKGAAYINDQTLGRLGNKLKNDSWDRPAYVDPTAARQKISEDVGLPNVPMPHDVARTDQIKAGVESLTGPFYKPQTTAGKYANTVGEFIPGALMAPGGAVGNAVKYGVLPGLASEATGQAIAKGPYAEYEPYARAAAGIGTAGIAALASRPPYAERLTGRAAANVTDDQFREAERLVADAAARGIQLTPAEAIQQISGGGSRLGEVQRITEMTASGGNLLLPAMSQRPAAMQAATNAAFDQVAPRSAAPSFIGRQAQETAEAALEHARNQINRIAAPFYRASETTRIPPAEYQQLLALPGYRTTLDAVRGEPQLNRYVAHLPDDSIGVMNEVKKQLRIAGENVAAPTAQNRNVQVSAGYNMDARDVADTGRRLSRDYSDALTIEEAGRRNFLGPLQTGPAGAISKTDDIASQGGAILNDINSPQEITRALNVMLRQNPDATRGVVREALGRASDKTVGALNNSARPDEFGGARLVKQLFGNDRLAGNAGAAINAVAPNEVGNIARLAEILQATGWRNRPGSATAFNTEALNEMRQGGAQAVMQAFVKPISTAKDRLGVARLEGQAERLANLLLSGPEGVRRVQELAARGDDRLNVLARLLLSGQASQQYAY